MNSSAAPLSPRISPLLSVKRGRSALDFYARAFNAVVLFQVESDSGEIVAQLTVDGAEFWVADESPAHQNFSPETLNGGTVRMILTVPDPDRVFLQAIAAGAKEIWPVAEQWGWRVGRVVDPFGHHWEIGRPSDAPPPTQS